MTEYYNKRIDLALKFAVTAHKNQVRKTDKGVPYAYHPISVGMMLRDAGYNDDVVIAGILHDTIEDTNTKAEVIEKSFGKKVRKLVESVSENKSLQYDERKHQYLEQVLAGSNETKAISIADALHNINSLIEAVQTNKDEVWRNFTKGKDSTVEQYISKTKKILAKWPYPMAREALKQARKLKILAQKSTRNSVNAKVTNIVMTK